MGSTCLVTDQKTSLKIIYVPGTGTLPPFKSAKTLYFACPSSPGCLLRVSLKNTFCLVFTIQVFVKNINRQRCLCGLCHIPVLVFAPNCASFARGKILAIIFLGSFSYSCWLAVFQQNLIYCIKKNSPANITIRKI